ncbi:MAG: glycoside hydrolase family 57 protein, partial [Limnochordia bacterium]
MEQGFLSIILHTHLPFVRHPEHSSFLEEDWLFEAITESYIPLLNMLASLKLDQVHCRITMSLTPPLMSMLKDQLLMERYLKHLDSLIWLSEKEVSRTRFEPHLNRLALMYNQNFSATREDFLNKYHGDLIGAFRHFQEAGLIEIMASAATHGYLPLMIHPEALRAQIQIGIDYYTHVFGISPGGFWLPECAYTPGVDEYLADGGIRYFIMDSHGILHSKPRPRYAVYAPVYCPSGVAAFGRDWESSKQVWSAQEGYPGDWEYREFYRDIGHELDYEYLAPHLKGNIRHHTGIKYYRITGKTSAKQLYDPARAWEKAAIHAGNFMFNRQRQIEYIAGAMPDRKPIVVAPYDTELFGHWWYEGPQWLDCLIRKLHYDQDQVRLITPGDYLKMYPKNQVCTPSMSSWGYKGYNEVWLEGSNDWIYPHLHMMAERMTQLVDNHWSSDELVTEAIKQAARELVLAQSSDWAFIMKTGTMVSYAVKRTEAHIVQ